jgi:hypothetical protein
LNFVMNNLVLFLFILLVKTQLVFEHQLLIATEREEILLPSPLLTLSIFFSYLNL